MWVRCLQRPLKSSNLEFHSFNAYLYKPRFGDVWSFSFLNFSNLIKVFTLSIGMYWSLPYNFLNFCSCGALGIFYTWRGCICSYSVFHRPCHGLFLEDLLKKKIFVCSHFVFQLTNWWLKVGDCIKVWWRETVVIILGVFNILMQNHLSNILGKKKAKFMCLVLCFNSETLFSGRWFDLSSAFTVNNHLVILNCDVVLSWLSNKSWPN